MKESPLESAHEFELEGLDLALKEATIEHDPGEGFDKGVLRRVLLDRGARTVKFWMPAFFGALVAGLAVLSAIEVVSIAPARKTVNVRGQEARADRRPVIPDFSDPGGTVETR
jgi:hypothetical protein